MVLVVIGTIYQVDSGTFAVQEKIFRAFFIYWNPQGSKFSIPIFPGGYSLAGIAFLNLTASMLFRFRFSRKTLGIYFVHLGLILFAFGELLVGFYSTETLLPIELGQKLNYSLDIKKEEQIVDYLDRQYNLAIHPKHRYFPFSIELADLQHETHPGTNIPRNFSSLVNLYSYDGKFDRSALITMNQPLRYHGRTFYQANINKENNTSVLQVIENPVWAMPYLSSCLVIIGLIYQFMSSFLSYKGVKK